MAGCSRKAACGRSCEVDRLPPLETIHPNAHMIVMAQTNHESPLPETDEEIAIFVRGEQFLDRLADLEKLLQEAQANGDRMPSAAEIATMLKLPERVITGMLAGIAAEMVI